MNGRPKLDAGQVRQVKFDTTGNKVVASAYTRDIGGTLRRVRGYGPTPEKAEQDLIRKAERLGMNENPVDTGSHLADLIEAWFTDIVCSRDIREQTVRMYRTKARKLSREYGGITIADLTPARVQKIVNDIARRNGKKEYNTLRGCLDQILRYGVVTSLMPMNPITAIENPRRRPAAVPVSLTAEQIQVFRHEFKEYAKAGNRPSNRRNAQLAVDLILGLGGLRIAESLAIRRCDVDLEQSRVSINGTLIHITGKPVFRQDSLKYDGQEPYVQLDPDGFAIQAVEQAWEECPPYRRGPEEPLIGRVEISDSPWINPSIVAFHFDAVTWRPAFVEALAETGLEPKQVTPHTLRRSVATLVTRSSGLADATAMLAHADSRTTKVSYVTPELPVVDLSRLDGVLEMSGSRA